MKKPSRKRSSKKKMDADTTYMIANMIIPDSTPLAAFNAVYELHNDKLKTPDKAGHAASRDKEATLAGMIVYTVLENDQSSICKIFRRSAPDEIYVRMRDAIRALPSGTVAEEEAAGPPPELGWPSTIGAMALWRKPDDTCWTVFYHHPKVTARHAAAILKEVIDDFEKDDAAKAGSKGPKN